MRACPVVRNSVAAARTGASRDAFANLTRSERLPVDARSFVDVGPGNAQLFLEQSSAQRRVSTLLQRTVSLLPRALAIADGAVGPDASLFWSNVLERSIVELSSSSQVSSKATIAVCGFDKWARSQDLVTALLEDPFTSDSTYSDILRNRWKNTPSCISIEYGKPTAFDGELFSPSDWLQRFPHPVQLTEFPDLLSLSSISDETDRLLLSSDVLLLLCDPIVTPLSDLVFRTKHLLDKPNTILVLTSGSASDPHRQFVSRTLSKLGCRPGHVLFVDPEQALEAVTALQANPTSPSTIARYQNDTLHSRVSTVTAAISAVMNPAHPSRTPLPDLRGGTALSQVHGSLSASFRSVEAARNNVDHIASEIADLSSGIQKIREKARYEIFGKLGEDNNVETALSWSTKEMNALLGSFTFWKMVWRIDEIGALVSAAVQVRWCKELERQLVLRTGGLDATQREMTNSAFDLVSAASSRSLRSVVLENKLEQLTRSPTHALTTNSLVQPIHDRRSQLIQHTTTKLHREAQNAVIGVSGAMLSGAGLGWWLAFGGHMLSLGAGTEMETAIGSGALVAVGGLRWAVGKWERAKQRWMQDLARIGEGLTRDLHGTVERTTDEKVTIVASTACKGMQDLVDSRRNEISQLIGELRELNTELQACAQFPASWMEQRSRSVGKKNIDVDAR